MGRGLSAAFALAALMLAPVPAAAEEAYSVRNLAGRAFSCGLLRERRSVIDRFLLLSGAEWRQVVPRAGERVLLCDSHQLTPRYPMRSGVAYALIVDPRTGRIVLRPLRAAVGDTPR